MDTRSTTTLFNVRWMLRACCVGFLMISHSASAALVYLNDNRRVVEVMDDGFSYYGVTFTPDSPFADWNHPNQTSTLGASGFSARGGASAYGEYDLFQQQSLFDVSFSVSTDTVLDMTGSLSTTTSGTYTAATVSLYSGTALNAANLLYSMTDALEGTYQWSTTPFSHNAVLASGDYRVVLSAIPGAYTYESGSSFTVNASFEPVVVPLPAAGLLFASGLGLLSFCRKRAA